MVITKGTLIGKYRLESPLAQGGMGALWTARHVKLGNAVAVKFLAPALAHSRSYLARFEREAHAATAIQSLHVVQVLDFGVEDGTPYIVMELLEGEDLGSRLHRMKRLPLDEAAYILIQVGRALRRAHAAGIVHRDLKPGNIFIAGDDDEEVVKVLDFGIAKEAGTPVSEQTEPGTMLGSPHYVSPEQATGDKSIDHRSDLWSLAVVLYHMITGVLPFRGECMGSVLKKVFLEGPPRIAELAPDLPRELDGFFERALAKRRSERFQSIGQMVEAFMAIATPDEVVPPSLTAPASDEPPRSEPTLISYGAPPAPPPGAGQAGLREVVTVNVHNSNSKMEPAACLPVSGAAAAGPPAGPDTGTKKVAAGAMSRVTRTLSVCLVAAALPVIAAMAPLQLTPEPARDAGSPALRWAPNFCARGVELPARRDAVTAPSESSSPRGGQSGPAAPAPRPHILLVEDTRGRVAQGSTGSLQAK
jgi:serine/threonine protein kinase